MHLPFIAFNVRGYLRVRYPRLVNVNTDDRHHCLWIPEGEVSKVSSYTYCLLLLMFVDT